MPILTSYEEIKRYINDKNLGNGCELLTSKEEFTELCKNGIPTRIKLKVKCKCGNEFYKAFTLFKNKNQKQCNNCSKQKRSIKRTHNYKDILNLVESKNYIMVTTENEILEEKEKQQKALKKTKFTIQDKDGFYYLASYNQLDCNNSINKFDCSNPYTIQNIKLWCKLNNKQYEIISTEFKNCREKLICKCLKEECGEIFKMTWQNLSQGYNCGYCAGQIVGLSNCLATKNPKLAKEWHPTKNGCLTPYDVTCGTRKNVWWKCKECGYEWQANISNRNNGNNCPLCNESKGEKRITELLRNNQTPFIPQKEFDGLIGLGGGNLSYDFYIPQYNLLIEYQGIQHEKYVPGLQKSKKDFEKQQEHDRRKREYAKQHGIKLLEIWYYDYDRVEEILINNYVIN
jgi:hypothetical protein